MKLLYLSTDKQTYRTSSAIVLAALGSPGTHFFAMTHKLTRLKQIPALLLQLVYIRAAGV